MLKSIASTAAQRVMNCVTSRNQEQDWKPERLQLQSDLDLPDEIDLRQPWWPVENQGNSGACVGFAVAGGLLRYQLVRAGYLAPDIPLSARFVWMASKETDELTGFPTSFVEAAGTQLKQGLHITRRYGCVPDAELPMSGIMFGGSTQQLYRKAGRMRINNYCNLGLEPSLWKQALSNDQPVVVRIEPDVQFLEAQPQTAILDTYGQSAQFGHAVVLVGYSNGYFRVRNSWGDGWGDAGFVQLSNQYVGQAVTEAYIIEV